MVIEKLNGMVVAQENGRRMIKNFLEGVCGIQVCQVLSSIHTRAKPHTRTRTHTHARTQ